MQIRIRTKRRTIDTTTGKCSRSIRRSIRRENTKTMTKYRTEDRRIVGGKGGGGRYPLSYFIKKSDNN